MGWWLQVWRRRPRARRAGPAERCLGPGVRRGGRAHARLRSIVYLNSQVQIIRSKTVPDYTPPYTTVGECVKATIRENGFRGPFQVGGRRGSAVLLAASGRRAGGGWRAALVGDAGSTPAAAAAGGGWGAAPPHNPRAAAPHQPLASPRSHTLTLTRTTTRASPRRSCATRPPMPPTWGPSRSSSAARRSSWASRPRSFRPGRCCRRPGLGASATGA